MKKITIILSDYDRRALTVEFRDSKEKRYDLSCKDGFAIIFKRNYRQKKDKESIDKNGFPYLPDTQTIFPAHRIREITVEELETNKKEIE